MVKVLAIETSGPVGGVALVVDGRVVRVGLRPFGMLVGVGMHIGVAALMVKLWYFSAEMICFYLLFLPLARGSAEADTSS